MKGKDLDISTYTAVSFATPLDTEPLRAAEQSQVRRGVSVEHRASLVDVCYPTKSSRLMHIVPD